MLKIRKDKRGTFLSAVEAVKEKSPLSELPDVINELLSTGHPVNVIYTSGHWIDIDSVEDLVKASYFFNDQSFGLYRRRKEEKLPSLHWCTLFLFEAIYQLCN